MPVHLFRIGEMAIRGFAATPILDFDCREIPDHGHWSALVRRDSRKLIGSPIRQGPPRNRVWHHLNGLPRYLVVLRRCIRAVLPRICSGVAAISRWTTMPVRAVIGRRIRIWL